MRHLNGVYTQRYNRRTQSDGPLFRGRYKAILIEADAYLLNVGRYIHLNPVAAGLAKVPEDYPWSSYRAYLGLSGEPDWLSTRITLRMIGQRRQRERYRRFVEAGVDADTETFYGKKKLSPIWGREAFRERILAGIEPAAEIPESRPRGKSVTLLAIIEAVAQVFGDDIDHILRSRRGRGQTNSARMAAMYLGRKVAGIPLDELAGQFGLGSYGSVSGMVSRFAKAVQSDEALAWRIEAVAERIKEQT
jgi:hypothetical protein